MTRARTVRTLPPEHAKANGKPPAPGRCPGRRKPRREELNPGDNLCAHCSAKCCKYFALPIDTPTEWADFEYIRWFLFHERAAVFVENGDWYLLVYTRCKHLREDNRCAIYPARPNVCREYSTTNCEYEDDWVYDHYFETSEQVEEYAEAVLSPRPGRTIRSPKPEPPRGASALRDA
ncbi:MAG: YkgJ family cysteine cluster protein [Thermoguttaceae bacterium]|jgi:Fe-S-cluster containining protein|nr:YkgJ family cysteine cluster protein [Thermoguttaceae bacterium]